MNRTADSGLAAVMVITIMLLVFTLCITAVSLSKSQKSSSVYQYNHVQAHYNADAGIEKTIAQVREDKGWVKELPVGREVTIFNENDMLVKAVRSEILGYDSLNITSIGYCNNGSQTLKAEILLEEPLDFSKGIWVESIWAENAIINSDVYCKESALLEENVVLTGGVYKTGSIPDFCQDFYYERAEQIYDCSFNEACELLLCPENCLEGVCCYEGSLNIEGTYCGKGTIVAMGEVQVTGNLIPADGESVLTLVSAENINISSGTVKCLLYAGGNLCLLNKTFFTGSIIAGNMNISAESSFLFDESWGDAVTETAAGCLKLKKWMEEHPIM